MLSKETTMFKHILLATDGSHLSQKAVHSAIAMALAFKADLLAVKVIPHYIQTYFEGSLAINDVDVKQIETEWAASAEKVLKQVAEQAKAKGLSITTQVVKSDDIAQGLIDTADKHASDLIVMASHGRKGIKRLLLGSETISVLTHAKLPVLVLR
jgi:nucleotide-binding universal stress UspA family protein